MSQYKETIDADLTGRVMSLEQRTKGLQGRISALEMCLSGSAGHSRSVESGACDDTEFVPAAMLSHLSGDQEPGTVEERFFMIEPMAGRKGSRENRLPVVARAIDTTGIIAGGILLGAGLLLYSGNLDIIKNPLLAMGCGILLIAGVAVRLVL